MSSFVLDCSVTMAWCFDDEATLFTDRALEKTGMDGALVPSIWALEIQNVLLVAERRGRLERAHAKRFLEILGALPIYIDREDIEWPSGNLMAIARDLNLSSYDAAYIELAMRQGVPIATLDKNLLKAAKKVGVAVLD